MAKIMPFGAILLLMLSLLAFLSLAVPDTDGDGFLDNNDNCRTEPNGGVPGTLLEGETSTFMADGFSYDVTVTFVDDDEAKFTINAEATPKLHAGESYTLSDTSQILVTSILYQDYAGGVHSTSFRVGAQRDTNDNGIGDACESMNRPPVLTPIGNRPVAGQTLAVGQTVTFTVSATDEDGTDLTFGASMVGGGALLSGMRFENQVFNWVPLASHVGSHQVIFTVSDGQAQDSETITITVSASAQSTEEQRYQALVSEFNDLEDDYSLNKRRYERAVDEDDERDIDDYADKLEDIDDDLADLEDDVEDLLDDVEGSNLTNRRELADDVEDLQDDIERVRDRIDTLLNGDEEVITGTTITVNNVPPVVQPQPSRPRVIVETLDFPGGNVPNTVEEPTENWPETRKMVLVGAGIVVLIAVIIFLVALMMV